MLDFIDTGLAITSRHAVARQMQLLREREPHGGFAWASWEVRTHGGEVIAEFSGPLAKENAKLFISHYRAP